MKVIAPLSLGVMCAVTFTASVSQDLEQCRTAAELATMIREQVIPRWDDIRPASLPSIWPNALTLTGWGSAESWGRAAKRCQDYFHFSPGRPDLHLNTVDVRLAFDSKADAIAAGVSLASAYGPPLTARDMDDLRSGENETTTSWRSPPDLQLPGIMSFRQILLFKKDNESALWVKVSFSRVPDEPH